MSFGAPLFLLALLAVPAALGALWLARRRARRYAVRFTAVPVLAGVLAGRSQARRHAPTALFLAALAALALALARPHKTVAVPIERASVVLVTDSSGSMRADDVSPTRLDAAQAAAGRFLDTLPKAVRVGAVAFSDSPYAVVPPDTDHDQARTSIESLTPDGATATGDALAAALGLVDGARKDRPPAAIVLLSDGKRTTGRDPIPVARRAARLHVPIYTVALGTEDGTLDGPFGQSIPVAPDPETLRKIARASGGRAFAVDDADALDAVYENLGSRLGTRHETREVTAGFAAGGLVLLVAAAGLSLRWQGRLP
jgi:Ca-activated chloride channel family protein